MQAYKYSETERYQGERGGQGWQALIAGAVYCDFNIPPIRPHFPLPAERYTASDMAKLLHCHTHEHTTYPKVERAIKAPLSNIFHTNIESNDFMQSEMSAHAANYTVSEQLWVQMFFLLHSCLQLCFAICQYEAN